MSGLMAMLLSGCASSLVAGTDDTGPLLPMVIGTELAGLDLEKLTLNQAVEVTLMTDFKASKSRDNVPIVAGRPALVRAFVAPQAGWSPREVQGLLTVQRGDEFIVLEDVKYIDKTSKDANLDTTLGFRVPAPWVTVDTTFRITLHETSAYADVGPGDTDRNLWDTAVEGMPEIKAGHAIRVHLIPIRYMADGTGHRPSLGDAQIGRIHDAVWSTYPVTEVEISVGEELEWTTHIRADGSGWDTLLGTIALMRSSAEEPDNVYYYGYFKPDTTLQNYCEFGCVLGLSLIGGPQDVWSRASIGLGFKGTEAGQTLIHEVGHAHGRSHAPCGLGGQAFDTSFPHNDANLGSWGYNQLTNELYRPTDRKDMMSYCEPYWISDYTYDALHTRIEKLSDDDGSRSAASVGAWLAGTLREDGTVTPIGPLPVRHQPSGEARPLEVIGDDGSRHQTTGYVTPFDHLDGGLVVLPDPGPFRSIQAR